MQEVVLMKKKLFLTAVVSAVTLVFASVSLAQDIKIGYVDFSKIQTESKAGKNALTDLEAMFKEKQNQLDQRQSELEKLLAELEKQGGLLSEDVRKQKEDKLQKDYKELQRFKADSEEELNKKKAEMAKNMYQGIENIINKYGEQEGYTLILERSIVLFAPEGVDITDQIIAEFDKNQG